LTTVADTKLNASVDRTKVYENDTLMLKITGNTDMEFSFGGLMNFGRNQIESPKIEGLENDFEILDQQQSYNMQSINGKTTSLVTWTYSLAPKHVGQLTIPEAIYNKAHSKAISIHVVKGKAPKDTDNPPDVFMEVEVDKSNVFVQEQVLYTLRLYTLGRLASGNLSTPESNDAIIEAFGDDSKYYRMAYNRRYEVVERKYLVFPQKSGHLTLDAQSFNGMLIDTQNRRRLSVHEKSDPIELTVNPPPASFTGTTWLPAKSFNIEQSWEGNTDKLMVGNSITRTIKTSALGLLGSALPPLKMTKQAGIKIYPDKPSSESVQHNSGAQSSRIESTAIVAVSADKVTLPEISIPWWDTVNNVEKVAKIPATTLNIIPNPETASLTKQTKVESPNNKTQEESLNMLNINQADKAKQEAQKTINTDASESTNPIWFTVIILIVLGWITTTFFLIKKINRQSKSILKDSTFKQDINHSERYKLLIQSIKNNHPDATKHLILWAQSLPFSMANNLKINSINDLSKIDESLTTHAKAFEAQFYSANKSNSEQKETIFQSEEFLNVVKSLAKTKAIKIGQSPLISM